MDERQLRQAAAACYFNSRDLHLASGLLGRNGYDPQASALSVLALEELTKAVVYLVSAIRTDLRDTLKARLSDLTLHNVKQRLSAALFGAGIMARGPDTPVMLKSSPEATREYTVSLLTHLVRFVGELLLQPKPQAKGIGSDTRERRAERSR